jgi:3-hydroxymyristoyl/3-hydroxydecanoyl-(acyl carrier protein) dehydratase
LKYYTTVSSIKYTQEGIWFISIHHDYYSCTQPTDPIQSTILTTETTCLQFVNLSAFIHRQQEATAFKLQETHIFRRYKNSAGEQQAFLNEKENGNPQRFLHQSNK